MSTITKIRHIFNRQVKIKLIILLIAIIVGALLETAALSAMSPFISVLMDNSVIKNNSILSFVYNLFGFKNNSAFLAFLAFLLAFIYIFRGVYLFILARVQYRFLSKRQIELSDRILTVILGKPYLYHVNKNLAELQRIILYDVLSLINLIFNVLMLMSDFFMSLFILVFLLIISPPMTISVLGLSLICVLLYFKVFRVKIKEAGEENRIKNVKMTKAVNQALGGIKELKVLKRENFFIKEFRSSGDDYVNSNQRFQVYNSIPKLLIESICFSGAFLLIGVLILMGTNMETIVPQLSLFVLASFRLLPAVSRFTGYIGQIVFYKPSVDAVYTNLFENDENYRIRTEITEINNENTSDIIIKNLTFQYPNTTEPVLANVSLSIPQKKSVAFVGPTGAGKTTLADIILGIYIPQEGNILYNGKSIYSNSDEWTKHIGYIPQQIYLLDETILENIAFGIPKNEINEQRVWETLEQSQLKEFVNSLPDKLNTIVGDRGIRLSGGQRQRIGIARALYTNPDILILDEATSSLDNETEKAVMEAIENFQGEKTMIIIAHRLSTIEHCDIIYHVENKNVVRER